MKSALQEPSVLERLLQEVNAHRTRLGETFVALREGRVDHVAALRSCALELHAVKGEAGLVGFTEIFTAIGALSDRMLDHRSPPPPHFWTQLEVWSRELLDDLQARCNRAPARTESSLTRGREELERCLGSSWTMVEAVEPTPSAQGVPPEMSPSAGRHLLVIDDSATVRTALAARLNARGYTVEVAAGIEEAADCLLHSDPDIVISDVHMPGVPGDEICRRIKCAVGRLIPVILYSSLHQDELSARASRAGADGFVSKTDGIDSLILEMDTLLTEEILF